MTGRGVDLPDLRGIAAGREDLAVGADGEVFEPGSGEEGSGEGEDGGWGREGEDGERGGEQEEEG